MELYEVYFSGDGWEGGLHSIGMIYILYRYHVLNIILTCIFLFLGLCKLDSQANISLFYTSDCGQTTLFQTI